MEQHKNFLSEWPILLGIAVAMLAAYGGAYAALAQPKIRREGGSCIPNMVCGVQYTSNEQANAWVRQFFYPANVVDRSLFKERWPGRYNSKLFVPQQPVYAP